MCRIVLTLLALVASAAGEETRALDEFFKGEVADYAGRRVTLRYDFSHPSQLEDFEPIALEGLCPRGSILGELLVSPRRLRWPRRRDGGALTDMDLPVAVEAAAERMKDGATVLIDGGLPLEEIGAAAEIAAAWEGVRLCCVIGPEDEQALIRYNVMGVALNVAGFEKLQQEISLSRMRMSADLMGQRESITLHGGTVPLGTSFEKLIIREARVPRILFPGGHLQEWTPRVYYEVCVEPRLYEEPPTPS